MRLISYYLFQLETYVFCLIVWSIVYFQIYVTASFEYNFHFIWYCHEIHFNDPIAYSKMKKTSKKEECKKPESMFQNF